MTQSLITLNSCLAQHLLPLIKQNRYINAHASYMYTCTCTNILVLRVHVRIDYTKDSGLYL